MGVNWESVFYGTTLCRSSRPQSVIAVLHPSHMVATSICKLRTICGASSQVRLFVGGRSLEQLHLLRGLYFLSHDTSDRGAFYLASLHLPYDKLDALAGEAMSP